MKELFQPGDKIGSFIFVRELDPIKRIKGRGSRRIVLVRCTCGNEVAKRLEDIKYKNVKSCGCLTNRVNPPVNVKHGYAATNSKTPEYSTWLRMIHRTEKDIINSKWYLDKGIKMCDKWRNSFESFLKDMGPRPSNNHSIDRIDSNGDYCPENCRWATNFEQNRNKSSNVLIEYKNKSQCLKDWCIELGISYPAIQTRIKKLKWDPVLALAKPIKTRRKVSSESRSR